MLSEQGWALKARQWDIELQATHWWYRQLSTASAPPNPPAATAAPSQPLLPPAELDLPWVTNPHHEAEHNLNSTAWLTTAAQTSAWAAGWLSEASGMAEELWDEARTTRHCTSLQKGWGKGGGGGDVKMFLTSLKSWMLQMKYGVFGRRLSIYTQSLRKTRF